MPRRSLITSLLLGLLVPGIVAQEGPAADRIYVATYMLNYGDIPEYTAIYNEAALPILQELVDEGAIVGFGMRMHHTGGEYTLRESIIGHEETDFDHVWAEYNGRWAERHAASWERAGDLTLAHMDEVWNLDTVRLGEGGGGSRYLYETFWQVKFNDLDRWAEVWSDAVFPILETLIEDGRLGGYVVQGHNTGGRFNWKLAMLYDEWDDLDEMEAAFFGAVPLDHDMWQLAQSHKDELWQQLPPQ